jgi:hypothetical protein
VTTSLFALWRDDIGFGTPVYATNQHPFHPVGALFAAFDLPGAAPVLFLIGAATIVFAALRFVQRPTRVRWVVLAVTIAIAITGCSVRGIIGLAFVTVVALAVAAYRGDRRPDDGAIAGSVVAIAFASLLALPWLLPLRAVARVQDGAPPFNSVYLRGMKPFLARAKVRAQPRQWFFAEQFAVVNETYTLRALLQAPPGYPRIAAVDHIPDLTAAPHTFRLKGRNKLRGATVLSARGPGSRIVDVVGEGWNLLVSNRAWWPGWRAYSGGRRLRPVRVNGAFLGVFVPPGNSTIEFRYRPAELDDGLRAAAIALPFFFATAMWPWYRRFRTVLPGRRDWKPRALATSLEGIEARLARAGSRISSRAAIAAMLVIAAVYCIALIGHGEADAGGADSSGYLTQARLWRRGQLAVPVEMLRKLGLPDEFDRSFMPLGFVRGSQPGVMVPSYPPGLPLHFAAIESLFGERALRAVNPLLATGSLILLFLLARSGGAIAGWAFASVALLAASPVFISYSLQPLSDIPATFWALVAIYLATRTPAGAGVAFAIAVLVRPTSVLLLPALLVLIPPRRLIRFVAAGAPFAIFQLFLNRYLYGSPFVSGYGSLSDLVSVEGFSERLSHYTYWLGTLFPLAFPFGFAGLAVRRMDKRQRVACAVWFGAIFLFYCCYSVYETWWYTRFLLPAIPAFLMLGAVAGTAAVRRYPALSTALAIAVTVVLVSMQTRLTVKKTAWNVSSEAWYRNAVVHAQPFLRRDAVVIAAANSGALYHYAGITPLRLEYVQPDNFAIVRRAAEERRLPIHALVAVWEIDELRRRAPGDWVLLTQVRDFYLFRLQ